MIKAVFFDLYGTLAGFSPSRYEIQSAACGQFGIELTEQGTLRGYGEADAFMTRQNATFPLRDMDEEEIYDFFKESALQSQNIGVRPPRSYVTQFFTDHISLS